MKSAVIFISNTKELQLSKSIILGKKLIEYTISELKRLDLDNIYICGLDPEVDNVVRRKDIKSIIDDLSHTEGRTLLLSPLYPLLEKDDYFSLLNINSSACLCFGKKLVKAFAIDNNKLNNFESEKYKEIEVEEDNAFRVDDYSDVTLVSDFIKDRINSKLINKGVIIEDTYNTYVGPDAIVDRGTVICPNCFIEGECLIGQNNIIKPNSRLENVKMGDNNYIDGAYIKDSLISSNCHIGINSHLESSLLFNNVRIGNYVDLLETKVGTNTEISNQANLQYTEVGEDVTIGTYVCTIGKDTRNKYATLIKSHSLIGAGSNLLAPLIIGEYAVIAAGSTIEDDVNDGDMAFARVYQTNKKGYGYRYLNKEK